MRSQPTVIIPSGVRTRPRLDTSDVRLAAPPCTTFEGRAAGGATGRLQSVRRVGLSAARSKRPTASAVAFPTRQRSTNHMAHHVACRYYPCTAPRKEFTDTARKMDAPREAEQFTFQGFTISTAGAAGDIQYAVPVESVWTVLTTTCAKSWQRVSYTDCTEM